eukprot:6195600-Pyramimonas_sp.AAC.2
MSDIRPLSADDRGGGIASSTISSLFGSRGKQECYRWMCCAASRRLYQRDRCRCPRPEEENEVMHEV